MSIRGFKVRGFCGDVLQTLGKGPEWCAAKLILAR
jgi:hypothetical protein